MHVRACLCVLMPCSAFWKVRSTGKDGYTWSMEVCGCGRLADEGKGLKVELISCLVFFFFPLSRKLFFFFSLSRKLTWISYRMRLGEKKKSTL